MQFLISSAPTDGPSVPELHRRLRALIFVVMATFMVLIVRLWVLQIVRGDEYYRRTLQNVVKQRYLPSIRGKIVDRNGVALADNRPTFSIYVPPKDMGVAEQATLARALDLSDEERALVAERVRNAAKRKRNSPILILADQDRVHAARAKQARLELPTLEVRDELYRDYPHGRVAAHLVGYMNQLSVDEHEKLASEGYDEDELIGRYGIEKAWENYLRGKKGIERYVANAKGEEVSVEASESLIDGPRFEAPVAGHNVVLTIDLKLQELVERAVRRHAAAAVAVVEVDSGRVLALVSTPTFDPNVMSGRLTQTEFALLNSDPRKPFLDKTLRNYYPPGSIYKFVTAIAALQDGIITSEEKMDTPTGLRIGGHVFHGDTCDKRTNMLEALQNSCNTYFWKLAEQIGIDRMAAVARDFGFGAPSGLGLNGDVSGRVPTKLWYEERGPFKVGYTLNASTGQGDVEVSVMQMVMAYAAIANGGELMVPQVVRRVETASGQVVKEFAPELRRTVEASRSTLASLRLGMWRVVNLPGGTAHDHAHSDVVEFAGKTGTAQVRNKRRQPDLVDGWDPARHHAWFAGFAPAHNPEIAVVVLIEHGGSGGKVAGPVARDVIEGYFTKVKPAHAEGGAQR